MPLVVAVLTVLVLVSLAGVGLALMEVESLRDRLSRLPQAAFLTIPGHYTTVQVCRDGWDVKEGVKEDPLRKPEKKK